MTVQLTSAQEEKLAQLAATSNRSPDELAQEALDAYFKRVEALVAAVREGEESAEREGWLDHDKVFENLHQRLRKTA